MTRLVLSWTPEMDAAIPRALEVARAKIDKHRGTRNAILADAAKQLKPLVQPLVARKLMTTNALAKRIASLNSVKHPDDPTRIWVYVPPKSKPTGEPQAQLQIPSPELAMLVIAKDVRAISKNIAEGHKDAADLAYMQVEALDRLTIGVESLVGMMARLHDRLDIIENIPRPELPLTGAPRIVIPPAKPQKNPVIPARMNDVSEISRADVCWGPLWDRLTATPLTKNERHWQSLYAVLVQKWQRQHSMKTELPTVIVYGWYPTVMDAQKLFYRLGPEKLYWISTYSVGKNVEAPANRIEPKAGQICLLLKHMGHADPRGITLAKDQCRIHGIQYYTSTGGSVNSDEAAYHLITRAFSRDWEIFQQMALHADTPKEANGHSLSAPIGAT